MKVQKIKVQVPCIDQTERWPTGCESVSAVMLLHSLGIEIEVDDFIGRYLTCHPLIRRGEQLTGPDPRRFFAGSPYDPDAMGCYAPVIKDALRRCLDEREDAEGWAVEDLTGVSMERICAEYLDRGRAVVFWACIDMKEPVSGPSWTLEGTGETFTWISNEHCMLLVGYDDACYYFNDPWNHHGLIGYERKLVEERHLAQHAMAVTAYRRN